MNTQRPIRVERGDDGTPTAVSWQGRLEPAKVLERWHFGMTWAKRDKGREYYRLELSDGTRLDVCHNLNTDGWVLERVADSALRFGRCWSYLFWTLALLFGAVGALRLVLGGDLLAFAHLTMALGLALIAVRSQSPAMAARLWYLPEFFIAAAALQYGYYWLGV